MKTVGVALVCCLNIGVDPPDVVKTSPCARMECWLEPSAEPPQKALEGIGSALQVGVFFFFFFFFFFFLCWFLLGCWCCCWVLMWGMLMVKKMDLAFIKETMSGMTLSPFPTLTPTPTNYNHNHTTTTITTTTTTTINKQSQYERWQPRARYKQCLDPTVDDVKKLCTSLRRSSRDER